ncbi:MAG: hypothetical protein OXF26_13665 [Alphaproteobacteria bacterium]|nr:hypothetical protein [Alphaproteobacteria bacterium]
MLSTEMIRDLGRALPWLVAEPQSEPIPAGVSLCKRKDLLDAHAEGLRLRHDTLHPVIDRAGRKLAAAFKEQDPAEICDPEGEGAEALEKAEVYFHGQRSGLSRFRETLVDAGVPPDHDVFEALDRLDALYVWIVVAMQEVRWTLLVADGVRIPPSRRTFTSGASLVSALDE